MLPSNKDWSMMRSLLRLVMEDSIEIYNVTISKDRYGNETKNRTLASGVIGQLSAASGNETKIAESLGAINNVDTGDVATEVMHLRLPYGVSLTLDQEVKSPDGKYWNVVQTGTSQAYTAAVEATLYRKIVDSTVLP